MFYHISRLDLGERIKMKPKVPETCDIEDEGDIPRICVSVDTYSCFKGILSTQKLVLGKILDLCRKDIEPFEELVDWIDKGGVIASPVLYVCTQKAFTPPDASDFRKNSEYWYLSETEFLRKGYICLQTLIESQCFKLVSSYNEVSGEILKSGNKALKLIVK